MTVAYREFLTAVSRTTGLDSDPAKVAAEGTLGVLACVLGEAGRERLNEALPGELRPDIDITGAGRDWDEPTFVRAVSVVTRHPVEHARLQAQAVLATLAEQDEELVAELQVPQQLQGLFTSPAPGGGVTAGEPRPGTRQARGPTQ